VDNLPKQYASKRLACDNGAIAIRKLTRIMVTVRAMQKPNIKPDMMNLWPRLRLIWKMVICPAAASMNKNRKTADMGTSTPTVGTPPTAAVVGAYGG
jgi:hypothetical protein